MVSLNYPCGKWKNSNEKNNITRSFLCPVFLYFLIILVIFIILFCVPILNIIRQKCFWSKIMCRCKICRFKCIYILLSEFSEISSVGDRF